MIKCRPGENVQGPSSVPDEVKMMAHHVKTYPDSLPSEDQFLAFQSASYVGQEVGPPNTHHFFYWMKASNACPLCGVKFKRNKKSDLESHAKRRHFIVGGQTDVQLVYKFIK